MALSLHREMNGIHRSRVSVTRYKAGPASQWGEANTRAATSVAAAAVPAASWPCPPPSSTAVAAASPLPTAVTDAPERGATATSPTAAPPGIRPETAVETNHPGGGDITEEERSPLRQQRQPTAASPRLLETPAQAPSGRSNTAAAAGRHDCNKSASVVPATPPLSSRWQPVRDQLVWAWQDGFWWAPAILRGNAEHGWMEHEGGTDIRYCAEYLGAGDDATSVFAMLPASRLRPFSDPRCAYLRTDPERHVPSCDPMGSAEEDRFKHACAHADLLLARYEHAGSCGTLRRGSKIEHRFDTRYGEAWIPGTVVRQRQPTSCPDWFMVRFDDNGKLLDVKLSPNNCGSAWRWPRKTAVTAGLSTPASTLLGQSGPGAAVAAASTSKRARVQDSHRQLREQLVVGGELPTDALREFVHSGASHTVPHSLL
jgi:hypothetical protein